METYQPHWRGKNIGQRKDREGKFIKMMGPDALLYVPVSVRENSKYKIIIEVAKNGGNGIVYCNIYGNKNFDFSQASFVCNSVNWSKYEIEVSTNSFPNTVPMVFRIWRAPSGTGSILIRKIFVELIETKDDGKIPTNILTNLPNVNSLKEPKTLPIIRPSNKIKEILQPSVKKMKVVERKKYSSGVTRSKAVSRAPKVEELIPGTDGIKNSVIISVKDRSDFLDRTLYTYAKQTMPLNEFEMVIIDDNSKEDILKICKKHSEINKLNFQYIKVDTTKGVFPQKGFTPALTNNIGFKNARGSVLIITGPETLQSNVNMEVTWEICKDVKCVYGVVYRSNAAFVDKLKENQKWTQYGSFSEILSIPGSKFEKPDLTGFWWYYAAARKEYLMNINGVDERYMMGIAAEDDDFAERMRLSGVQLLHDQRIVGIHQDHEREDRVHPDHKFRFNKKEWNTLRNHNCNLLHKCIAKKDFIANKNIDWGTEKAIVYKEIF